MAMTEERFFRGLLAALTCRTRFIDARDDRHQVALDHVVETLRALQLASEPGAASMPRSIRPGPVTGKYDEFDDALLSLQDLGYDSAQNPYYTSVELSLRKERVERVLGRFTDDERRVLDSLAGVFVESDTRAPT